MSPRPKHKAQKQSTVLSWGRNNVLTSQLALPHKIYHIRFHNNREFINNSQGDNHESALTAKEEGCRFESITKLSESNKKLAYQGTWNLWWGLFCWHPISNLWWIPHQRVYHLWPHQSAVLSPASRPHDFTLILSALITASLYFPNTENTKQDKQIKKPTPSCPIIHKVVQCSALPSGPNVWYINSLTSLIEEC